MALGGTAVGTGVNTHPEFASRVCAVLSKELGVTVRETDNHFQAQNTLDGVLAGQRAACARWRSACTRSPTTSAGWAPGRAPGIGELALPEVQPGSSIMPGKVNPVIAESVLQAVAQVIGNDAAVLQAAQGGVFELNMMMPVAGHNLLQSIELLAASARQLRRAVRERAARRPSTGPAMVERGLMLATALAPAVGYDAAAEIAKEAAKTGRTIREVAREKTKLSEEELDELLNPEKMTEPGLGGGPAGG